MRPLHRRVRSGHSQSRCHLQQVVGGAGMSDTTVQAEIEKSIYLPELATLLAVKPLTKFETFFDVRLDSGEDLGHMPGQFVQVSLPGIGESPISVSSSPNKKGSFDLVVRAVGSVTRAMHRMNVGDKVGIRGPFGTHFPVESDYLGKDLLFICGGIGLVPVRSAIKYVLENRKDFGKVAILFGARTPADRLFTDELAEWARRDDVELFETVDRGDDSWTGNTGVITTLMPKVDMDPETSIAIICGPPIMYKFVLIELRKMQIPSSQVYVSLERRMKCGVGKCGHCQINHHYVCLEGPVFKFADVAGLEEAI
jgi:sulfite reductase subunit B